MVLIFPNLCLWRRSLRSNLGGIDPDKLYRATLTDALENLNTQMSTSRRILSGIFSKNSENYELKPKFKL